MSSKWRCYPLSHQHPAGHHNLLMALTTGRPWMRDLQLDSTINEKLLFCCAPSVPLHLFVQGEQPGRFIA